MELIKMTNNLYVSSPSFYNDKTKDIFISKSNTLIEAGFDLTLAEHDLMTLAINKLHKQGTGNQQVFITAQEFAIANKISESHAYQQLKKTADDLMKRQLKFPLYIDLDKTSKGEPNGVGVLPPKHDRYNVTEAKYNWLQGVAYVEQQGFIYLHFSDPLKFLIDRIGEAYTNYNFSKTIDMKTTNAKRLYELVCKWKDLGQTKSMYVDEWKDFFGVSDKYPNIAEFKRRVLEPSIKAVNKQGEFSLELKQEKVGKMITHFQILIRKTNEENPTEILDLIKNTKPKFIKMSDAQLDTFSSKLADLPSIQTMADIGENMKPFILRLRSMLQEPKEQIRLMPYLLQLGFRAK